MRKQLAFSKGVMNTPPVIGLVFSSQRNVNIVRKVLEDKPCRLVEAVFDLEDAVEPVRQIIEEQGVEVILSRRGTAYILRQLSVPVVALPDTTANQLRALKKASTMQVKLLRVLQEQNLRRVGGTVDIPVDVRIIAATNRNLKEEVEAGRFRRDLYYRVAVVTQELPPLRSRAEDIPLLARYFLARLAEQGGAVPLDIEDDALDALWQYPFPGNVRELANILERAAVFCPPGGSIGLAHLPPEVSESAVHLSVSDPGSSSAVAARQDDATSATPVCPQAAAPCRNLHSHGALCIRLPWRNYAATYERAPVDRRTD